MRMKHESSIFVTDYGAIFPHPSILRRPVLDFTKASHHTYVFSFLALGLVRKSQPCSPPDERQIQPLEAGYSLDSTDELGWPDINVPNRRAVTLGQVIWVI